MVRVLVSGDDAALEAARRASPDAVVVDVDAPINEGGG
jgi:DNA-binding response OmpR family regulator